MPAPQQTARRRPRERTASQIGCAGHRDGRPGEGESKPGRRVCARPQSRHRRPIRWQGPGSAPPSSPRTRTWSGPIVIASTRVHTISKSNEANPDSPSASCSHPRRRWRCKRLRFLELFLGGVRHTRRRLGDCLRATRCRERHRQRPAEGPAKPGSIPIRPPLESGRNRRGARQLPRRPCSARRERRPPWLAPRAAAVNHRTAIGNVAPRATAGARISRKDAARRTAGKSNPGAPSR